MAVADDHAAGFGFIAPEGEGPDVFVPASAIVGGRKDLDQDQMVEYDLAQGTKAPQAENVNAII
ncbi:cold-shock protein [Streptomyces huasconensis]|uniref:cold-shock protein n=1 Tax=Streptomyces huasconensis TaxID=1854574 RepID=UPI0033ED52E5